MSDNTVYILVKYLNIFICLENRKIIKISVKSI
jgi:hypothetical protein